MNDPLSDRTREIERKWRAHIVSIYGHPDATPVRIAGMEFGPDFHPLNNWLSELRHRYDPRLRYYARVQLLHEEGRADRDTVFAAGKRCEVTAGEVLTAKDLYAKRPTINALPYTVEEIQ